MKKEDLVKRLSKPESGTMYKVFDVLNAEGIKISIENTPRQGKMEVLLAQTEYALLSQKLPAEFFYLHPYGSNVLYELAFPDEK